MTVGKAEAQRDKLLKFSQLESDCVSQYCCCDNGA